MPEVIRCSNCGVVLYRGDELTNPKEVIKRYNFRCPKCGRKLEVPPKEIKIS